MYNPPNPALFNQLVWAIVRQIPAGKASTYGQIASMIPPPEGVAADQYKRLGARWVGSAMHAAEQGIPWQRVINSQGKISLPKGSAGADEQRALLEMEGIAFDKDGKVNFEQVGWEGPPEEWLCAHRLLSPISLKKRPKATRSQPSLF
ncbi:MAG: MGMT family protein [Anaerolineae bacterium]|nr:MGMT family protein [Anaerolineae bacterium]